MITYKGDPSSTNKVDVKFLDKPNADSTQENLINRLEQWLYQTSMVANISDESFGNSSGTSLAYKLQAMSNLALNMQRKLRASLQERYRLFFIITENVPQNQASEYANIEYTFDRNIPAISWKNLKSCKISMELFQKKLNSVSLVVLMMSETKLSV